MKKEDVDKMTVQEACDYAVTKIVEQGGQCLSYTKKCIYGDGDQHHCAIGWLLDEDDVELMNFYAGVQRMAVVYPNKIPKLIYNNLEIFSCLQSLHDHKSTRARVVVIGALQNLGVDTSNPVYVKWIYLL